MLITFVFAIIAVGLALVELVAVFDEIDQAAVAGVEREELPPRQAPLALGPYRSMELHHTCPADKTIDCDGMIHILEDFIERQNKQIDSMAMKLQSYKERLAPTSVPGPGRKILT